MADTTNMSFEEILREQLAKPAPIKGGDGTIMPMQAMVMAVMNNAMKGDLGAILFIKGMTDRRVEDNDAYLKQQQKKLSETIQELCKALKSDGLQVSANMPELELIARQLVTLRRIAETMNSVNHRDIIIMPQKDGNEKTELSTTNRIYNDLYKQWKADWKDLRESIFNRQMHRKMLNH